MSGVSSMTSELWLMPTAARKPARGFFISLTPIAHYFMILPFFNKKRGQILALSTKQPRKNQCHQMPQSPWL
jgi:hypothetical protein